jgi:eukaryotic-like serine/threonine-protein kinase
MGADAWLVGRRFGEWEVTAFLADGGMARVWRVRHVASGRDAALKLCRTTDPDLLARAAREARIQAGLAHPNLLAAIEVLDVEGTPGILLEYVPGGLTLERHLARGPLAAEELDRIVHGLLDGVEAAHLAGFIHRDLKPANVLLSEAAEGLTPLLADFGLARPEFEPPDVRLTRMGMIMGSAAYMAPEQARDAGSVDARADVWSLGAMLYEMVSGVPAFSGDSVDAVLDAVSHARYRPLDAVLKEVEARWNVAVEGCLQVDPSLRIPDVATLRAVLRREQRWASGGSGSQPRSGGRARPVKARQPAAAATFPPLPRQAPASVAHGSWPPRWGIALLLGAILLVLWRLSRSA